MTREIWKQQAMTSELGGRLSEHWIGRELGFEASEDNKDNSNNRPHGQGTFGVGVTA